MASKYVEKAWAVMLRKRGYSYNEILKEVPVARSTLSLWLTQTPFSEEEQRLLKDRVGGNSKRGVLKAAATHRANREARDRMLLDELRQLYANNRDDRFFIAGILLYWAEGTKQGNAFQFTNSDSDMVNVMLDWVERYLGVTRQIVGVRLFAHTHYAPEHCEERWAAEIGVPPDRFKATIFTSSGKPTKKHPDYKGCVRIEITSGLASRKMQFLQSLFLADYKKERTLTVRATGKDSETVF